MQHCITNDYNFVFPMCAQTQLQKYVWKQISQHYSVYLVYNWRKNQLLKSMYCWKTILPFFAMEFLQEFYSGNFFILYVPLQRHLWFSMPCEFVHEKNLHSKISKFCQFNRNRESSIVSTLSHHDLEYILSNN